MYQPGHIVRILLGIDTVNCPWPIRAKIWEKLGGDWKLDHLDGISTEISLSELDERIDLILGGKSVGRSIVKLP